MDIINSCYEKVAIDTLVAHSQNPRHGDLVATGASIETNGFYGALEMSTRRTPANNHRWRSAKDSGAAFVPVIWMPQAIRETNGRSFDQVAEGR